MLGEKVRVAGTGHSPDDLAKQIVVYARVGHFLAGWFCYGECVAGVQLSVHRLVLIGRTCGQSESFRQARGDPGFVLIVVEARGMSKQLMDQDFFGARALELGYVYVVLNRASEPD